MVTTSSTRQQAVQSARQLLQAQPVFLDTETTGLSSSDEIVEIAIVDAAGQVLADKLVKPSRPIPKEATRIHGITDEQVKGAPSWPILWMSLRPLLIGKPVVAYNSDFDLKMMRQSHDRYRQPWRENLQMFDLLKLYAQFRGEWDSLHSHWKYFSLDEAGKASKISLPNAHRSLADTLLARELLLFIANSGS